jgi:hypothetical protein
MSGPSPELSVVGTGDARRLRAAASSAAQLTDFEGTVAEAEGGAVLDGPLSAKNAEAVRRHVPSLRPRPIGLATSAGVGDRLGLATPGQVRAFRRFGAGIVPVFAQQSAREMDRLDRSPQQVLDDATFGCLQAGWEHPVGSDADHLKSTAEIDRCLDAGFTSFTLDPGDHVRHLEGDPSDAQLAALPWDALEDTADSMIRRYSSVSVDLGDSVLQVPEGDIRFAAAKYGPAVAHVVSMYRHLVGRAGHPIEVEVSVDETDDVTTLVEHVYLATEMKRLGMEWVGFAPRYVGRFEKGVDYIGDPDELYRSLVHHASIARAFGPYKISLHSGSDKFSIYERVVEATGRLVHLKTSGTNYLAAVEIAARFAPDLFREIYEASRDAYRGARSSYHVSAQLERTPSAQEVPDDRLPELVAAFDSRQILHVGYGPVLRSEDGAEPSHAATALRALLGARAEEYASLLESHIGRHLAPFSSREAS